MDKIYYDEEIYCKLRKEYVDKTKKERPNYYAKYI
jgi:hypothetical protein